VSPSRRALLAAPAALPWLGRALAAPAAPRPRLVLLMQSNGTSQANFWPGPDGTSTILAPLLDDARLRTRTTVLKGLYNHDGGTGNGHDWGFAGLWSGYRTGGTFFDPWGNGISIDQLLRKTLTFTEPYPTLNCGVLASSIPTFKAHRRSFSYLAPARQVPTQIDPWRMYDVMFARSFGAVADARVAADAERRLAEQRSVLDSNRADLAKLRRLLGGAERDKLDIHLESLRAFERRLGGAVDPPPADPARCASLRPPTPRLDLTNEDNVPALCGLMLDLVSNALACNLSRIVTFQFGSGGEKWFFRWLGINENSHDNIAHRDSGDDPVITAKIVKMNVWYAQQVAAFARALDAIPEGNGSVLDNTLIVWGNEVATGPHAMDDIPVVLIGGAAGRLRRPGLLVDEGPQDYHRLGTSVLRLMGVPAQGFGEADDCGPVRGLNI
jgi:hypothetical protein